MKQIPTLLVRFGFSIAFAAAMSACGPSWYVVPSPQQPHATLDVRRVFQRTAGTTLALKTSVSGHPVEEESFPATAAGVPITRRVLVHPRPARFTVTAAFSHPESRWTMQTYEEQQSYLDTEYYYCGNSGMCSRLVTKYRSVTKYRPVWRTVAVSDGACSASFETVPEVGHAYALDFTYRADGTCRVACYEKAASAAGGAGRQYCRLATPEENRIIESDLEDAGAEE
jgi:hypothetical protein